MSKKTYLLDATSLQTDPNMSNLFLYPGSHTAAHESETGKAIHKFLTSRLGVAVLMGAVISAPSRPPVIATEPFIAKLVGDAGFSDEMKKYTGRVVRQIVEHLGGQWLRRGVKVTIPSRYGSGSIYTFSGGPAFDLAGYRIHCWNPPTASVDPEPLAEFQLAGNRRLIK